MPRAAMQTSFPFNACPVAAAVEAMADAGVEARGAVFTRREVVDFILDLVGYTTDQSLHQCRLLEPSAGQGDFLVPAVERLLAAYRGSDPVADLAGAIRAVEIHRESVSALRQQLIGAMTGAGYSLATARTLCETWLVQGDFLLLALEGEFTHVVGNPPYLRQEDVAPALMREYRLRYATIFDRADLYVPFFERGLRLLAPGGRLGFICSDRWMKNRYGGPLRELVSRDYHLATLVDMVDTPAFRSDVIAYPAITVIMRDVQEGVPRGETRMARRPAVEAPALISLARDLLGAQSINESIESFRVPSGGEPWVLETVHRLDVVRRLEARFPAIEEVGCKIGIGVATGADRAFIAPFDEMDVEPERKLRLVTTRDIRQGTVRWEGLGVINPFLDDGRLADLRDFPRFARWLEARGDIIRRRNVARRNPAAWYRTIDRIHAELAPRAKLLIPDIKGDSNVVLEPGGYYPHHNLYYIVAAEWDLRALQSVLQSGIARLFVAAYSVRMRGGHLRFQAQYLRRIRLPRWRDVAEDARQALIAVADGADDERRDALVADLYGISRHELAGMPEIGVARAA